MALPPALGVRPGPEAAAFYFAEATKGRALLEAMAQAARQTTGLNPGGTAAAGGKLTEPAGRLQAQWEKALKGGEEAVKEVKDKRES